VRRSPGENKAFRREVERLFERDLANGKKSSPVDIARQLALPKQTVSDWWRRWSAQRGLTPKPAAPVIVIAPATAERGTTGRFTAMLAQLADGLPEADWLMWKVLLAELDRALDGHTENENGPAVHQERTMRLVQAVADAEAAPSAAFDAVKLPPIVRALARLAFPECGVMTAADAEALPALLKFRGRRAIAPLRLA